MKRIVPLLPLLATLLALPALAAAHGGGLDSYGCHHNRKLGGYHCHRGQFAGREFTSQAEMLALLRSGGQSPQQMQSPTRQRSRSREIPQPKPQPQTDGSVLHVVNGDTVTARIGNQEKKVRLYGITAPRLTQPHGLATQGYLETLVLNRAISVDPVETDRYGRTIGIVALRDGRTLQEKLLAEGYAWLSPKYCTRQECSRWKELEAEARAARRGLWQDENPVPPWQWKGKHPATAQAPVQDAAAQHTSGDAPSASLVKPIQTGLRSLDFDPGAADGKLTERTRQAIRKFQEAKGLKADGMPSQDVLNEIIGALMERIQNESQGETDKDVLKRLHQYDAMIKEIMG